MRLCVSQCVCVCVRACVLVKRKEAKLSECLADNKEQHSDHVVHSSHLSLKQWPANKSRFVYRLLIKPEYDVLWWQDCTGWISLNELLASIATQLAHSTINQKSDSAVHSQHL